MFVCPILFFNGADRLTASKAIARGQLKASLNNDPTVRVLASQNEVAKTVSTGHTVYGFNTGFGILATKPISAEDTATLPYKILQSRSVGVGEPIAPEVSKLMLITKVQPLAQGYSLHPGPYDNVFMHM